jgi:protein-disulfide isomerase
MTADKLGLVGNRVIDLLTGVLMVVAVFLLARSGSQVRSAWASYRSDQAAVDAARRNWDSIAMASSALTSGAGPVIVEVSDYQCTYCRSAASIVDSAGKRGVRVVYLNYPLSNKSASLGSATAALCADEAGKFREMHRQLMTSDRWQRDSNWVREARLAGVSDISVFADCLQAGRVRSRLVRQRALADSLRVTGTPTFVSRTGIHRGVPTVEQLLDLAGTKN